MENSIQPKEIEAIKSYIKRAKQTLESAKFNLDANDLLTAQNRIYYACFYIVKPLSLLDNFVTSKHKVLLDWFNKKYIYDDKIFQASLFKMYKKAFDSREKADYSISVIFTKNEAIENYNNIKLCWNNRKIYFRKNWE